MADPIRTFSCLIARAIACAFAPGARVSFASGDDPTRALTMRAIHVYFAGSDTLFIVSACLRDDDERAGAAAYYIPKGLREKIAPRRVYGIDIAQRDDDAACASAVCDEIARVIRSSPSGAARDNIRARRGSESTPRVCASSDEYALGNIDCAVSRGRIPRCVNARMMVDAA